MESRLLSQTVFQPIKVDQKKKVQEFKQMINPRENLQSLCLE